MDNNGNNVLHYVVLGGKSLRLAMLLCAKGADIDKANIIGNTPLHLSVMNQRNEMIAFFAQETKNINAVNSEGKTALGCALEFKKGNRCC